MRKWYKSKKEQFGSKIVCNCSHASDVTLDQNIDGLQSRLKSLIGDSVDIFSHTDYRCTPQWFSFFTLTILA